MNSINQHYTEYAKKRLMGKQSIISSFFLVYPYLKEKRVLDIGCSDGLYLKYFKVGSVGLEQMKELSGRAKELGHEVINGSIMESLPHLESNSCEAVFFSHVMEHLDSPLRALQEINRILINGGYLILGLPTEKNLFRFILRKDYFNGTHVYAFSVRNAKKLLEVTGFETLKVFYDLPKCQGKLGKTIIQSYQYIPFKEHISMAYWIVARKIER
jgi:SAM-dependent methyltransferase